MRTKVKLDPDAVLVTQYSASQPDISYEPIWKCRVSNISAGEKRELIRHMVAQYQHKQGCN